MTQLDDIKLFPRALNEEKKVMLDYYLILMVLLTESCVWGKRKERMKEKAAMDPFF